MPNINGTEGVILTARADQGGCDTDRVLGIFSCGFIPVNFSSSSYYYLPNTFILIKFQTINIFNLFISANQSFLVTTVMSKKTEIKQGQVAVA